MNTRTRSPLGLILLAGMGLILVLFIISYMRARQSDRGTSYDDSPAAEIGAAEDRQ